MIDGNKQKIPCTVGVLAYNSGAQVARALGSVADFAEIIVADGGSTDRTVEIARTHGARVIEQSNPGHPITDFAQERNRLLGAATTPWFFYLDSDEIMSPALVEAIRTIATDPHDSCGAYRVRYCKASADGKKIYRTYKEYYQIRLVRTQIGARFVRPVHERLELPTSTRVGQREAPWYVPFDTGDLNLGQFARKAWRRTAAEARAWQPQGALDALRSVVGLPLLRIGKSLVKMIVVKLRYGEAAIPARYELLRMLYAAMLGVQSARRLLGLLAL